MFVSFLSFFLCAALLPGVLHLCFCEVDFRLVCASVPVCCCLAVCPMWCADKTCVYISLVSTLEFPQFQFKLQFQE
jgi:hypothetical protein